MPCPGSRHSAKNASPAATHAGGASFHVGDSDPRGVLKRQQLMEIDFANANRKQIYSLLNGLVAPRPIAWITSMNGPGNLGIR